MEPQNLPVAVIADAHIGGPGGPAEPLVEQLEELGSGVPGHLVLMGDLFHVWVGQRSYETPEIRQVVAALAELRVAGWRIDYIEGNRDFFIGNVFMLDCNLLSDGLFPPCLFLSGLFRCRDFTCSAYIDCAQEIGKCKNHQKPIYFTSF